MKIQMRQSLASDKQKDKQEKTCDSDPDGHYYFFIQQTPKLPEQFLALR